MAQRVPPSLLLLLRLRVATATERDPGPVSAFSFSCTMSLPLRRLRPGPWEQAAAWGTDPAPRPRRSRVGGCTPREDPFPVSRGQNTPSPPSSVPLLAPSAGAEARAGSTGGCTGALRAPGASRSPVLVLPVLGAGHSGSRPLMLCPPAPELPGTAQWGPGTSHLRVPEQQQQEEEGGREGLRYGLREPGAGGLGVSPFPLAGR